MQITRPHGKDKSAAIAGIDRFLDQLMQKPFPGDVDIRDAVKVWTGDEMNFSFKAKKGFFEVPISGTVRVDDTSVHFSADLPSLVTAFIPEEKIAGTINAEFDRLFG